MFLMKLLEFLTALLTDWHYQNIFFSFFFENLLIFLFLFEQVTGFFI